MICEVCHKNEANIVFQIFNNGRLTTRTICGQCAMKAQSDFFRTLRSLGMHNEEGAQQEEKGRSVDIPDQFCPSCGTPVSNIQEDGTFGCADCYEAGISHVRDMLRHHPADNTEEADEKQPATEEVKASDVAYMAHQLREAIVSEDYEQAAALRDRIREAASGECPHE